MKGPVTIREKKGRNGVRSLFLDICFDGKRKKEYLKLYLVPENSKEDRDANKEAWRAAKLVCAQRLLDINAGRFDFGEKKKPGMLLGDYFTEFIEHRAAEGASESLIRQLLSVARHVEIFDLAKVELKEVNSLFVRRFKEYLASKAKTFKPNPEPLSANSRMRYFSLFRTVLHRAYADELIDRDPIAGVSNMVTKTAERSYLTLDEVRTLAATACPRNERIKEMFLFSCLSGLRFSDCSGLRWRDVRTEGEFTRIVFRQQKTGEQEYVDLNPQAVEYMGARGKKGDLVFTVPKWHTKINEIIGDWARSAGIGKRVTFHTARHTFAVVLLDLGADIYTLQKLLGHRSIKTTQVYAHLLDKKKRETAMMIPQIK